MKNKFVILLFLTCLLLGCTTTKKAVPIEDEWNPIISNAVLLGEWQCVYEDCINTLTFSIDNNQNYIFLWIANYEPMLDKAIYDLRVNHGRNITKDELWEMILSRNNNLEKNEKEGYIYGKYYLKRTKMFLSSENIEKKLDERFLINQFGNKLKMSENIEDKEELIFIKNK